MSTRLRFAVPLLAALVALAPAARAADAAPVAAAPADDAGHRADLAAVIGTEGIGGQFSWLLVPHALAVRVGANAFNYTHDLTSDDIHYVGKLKLSNQDLLLDWHPFSGWFRFSTGVVFDQNSLKLTGDAADSGGTYEFNGNTYSAAQVGTLSASVKFRAAAPYLGIGWSDSSTQAGLHFVADIGVVAQGTPKASLSASGSAANNAQFQSDLRAEQAKLQDSLDAFRWYPVIQLGLGYRF